MNPEIQQALNSFRRSDDRMEIWEAARTLVRLDGDEATPQLIELAKTPGLADRRLAAIWTLGFLRAVSATESLLAILNDSSELPAVRAQAAESLGYIGDSDKGIVIRPSLVNNLRDPNSDVVYWSAFALRTVGDMSVLPALKGLVGSSAVTSNQESVATEAKEAIEQILLRHANRIE
jgi:HEAT repeat protein